MTLIYALGDGWGHLNRAMAFSIALLASGPPFAFGGEPIRILTSSKYHFQVRHGGVEIVYVRSIADTLAHVGRLTATDTFVVDTFDRGIHGELGNMLAGIQARKILVARDVIGYSKGLGDASAYRALYDCILPCEGGRDALIVPPTGLTTEPQMIDVLVLAGGDVTELGWYGEVCRLLSSCDYVCLANQLPVGCVADRHVRHWPGIDYILRSRIVIGGGGYNTVHECAWAGIPLVAKCWPRRFDDQLKRAALAGATIVKTPQEAVEASRPYRGEERI